MYSSSSASTESSCKIQESCCSFGCNSHYQSNHSVCQESWYSQQTSNCNTQQEENIFDTPIEINDVKTTNIDLPPLCWTGYNSSPQILTLRNTGRTVLINGQWTHGRPYVNGGPLNGSYIFSQIHFHCPSEHEINGRRYPLEMHVVHYKTTYLTQERAMYEKDGTIVLVYLFQVANTPSTQMSQITSFLSCVDEENSSIELPRIDLDQIVPPFKSNYYLYFGSVSTEKNSYLLQWIVYRKICCIARQEIDDLYRILSSCNIPFGLKRMNPRNDEVYCTDENEIFEDPTPTISQTTVCTSHCSEYMADECHHQHRLKTKSKSQSSLRLRCFYKQPHSSYASLEGREKCNESKKQKRQVTINTSDECHNVNTKSSVLECDPKSEIAKQEKRQKSCEKKTNEKKTENKDKCKSSDSGSYKDDKKTKSKKEKSSKVKENEKAKEQEKEERKREIEREKEAEREKHREKQREKEIEKEKQKQKKKEMEIEKQKQKEKEKLNAKEKENEKENSKNKGKEKENDKAKDKENDKAKEKENDEKNKDKRKNNSASRTSQTDSSKSWNEENKTKQKSKEQVKEKDVNIKTIYDKKEKEKEKNAKEAKESNSKDSKKEKREIQVNYLFSSSNTQTNLSNADRSSTSKISEDIEMMDDKPSKNCFEIPTQVLLRRTSVSDADIPATKAENESKEFCLLLEHFIRSDKSEKQQPSWNFQEYHVAIEYDHNILQEYNGMFESNRLVMGTYEKLHLVPKYNDSKDLHIALTDCSIKTENLEDICIRAKFLFKENSLLHLNSVFHEKRAQDIIKYLDAGTQYTLQELGLNNKNDMLNHNLEGKGTQILGTVKSKFDFNVVDNLNDLKNKSELLNNCLNRYIKEIEREENEDESQPSKTETTRGNKSRSPTPEDGTSNRSHWLVNENEKSAKIETKYQNNDSVQATYLVRPKIHSHKDEQFKRNAIKVNGQTSSSTSKIAYFVYDKVEKDLITGKKVFVGSFRTKEEVKLIQKFTRENVPKINIRAARNKDSKSLRNNYSNGKRLKTNSSDTSTSGCQPKPNFTVLKSNIIDTKNLKKNNIDISNSNKHDRRNYIIKKVITLSSGKVQNVIHESKMKQKITDRKPDSLDQDQGSRASFTLKRCSTNLTDLDNNKKKILNTHKTIDGGLLNPRNHQTVMQTADLIVEADSFSSNKEYEEILKSLSLDPKKSKICYKSTKSGGAVVIVPLDVESWSKVELILVEHDNVKSEKPKTEYIPCLNYYK